MGEYYCREGCYLEFFDSFWAGLLREEEVFDRWMIAKDRNAVLEVGLEGGWFIVGGVESEDEEGAEIVE